MTSGLRLGLTIERQNGRSNKKWLSNNTDHLINREFNDAVGLAGSYDFEWISHAADAGSFD